MVNDLTLEGIDTHTCYISEVKKEKTREINTPLKLSGCIHIENDFMYICSRNILGIDRIKLNE